MRQRQTRSTWQSTSKANYRDIYVFICDHYRKYGAVPSQDVISARLGVQKTYLSRFNAFVKAMGVEIASLAAGRVRIPWPVGSLRDMLEAADLYACQTGRRPSFSQLAEALNMSEEQLRRVAPRKVFHESSRSWADRCRCPDPGNGRLSGLESLKDMEGMGGMVVREPERILVYFRDGHLLRKQALPLGVSLDGLAEPARNRTGPRSAHGPGPVFN